MKNSIHKKILSYYNDLLKKNGYSPISVGWGTRRGKQTLRFDILSQIGPITNSSILDVGCGFGDFFGYLKHKKIIASYYGVDINPNLIQIGKQVYPNIKLEVRDIEQNQFRKKFDWIIASGITSHAATYSYIDKILSEMFRICKKGVAINFVSNQVDYKIKGLFYSSPEKILSLTKKYSNRIIFRHDYMPFEFTVYLYKNNTKTKNLIFKDYIKDKSLCDKIWIKNNVNYF